MYNAISAQCPGRTHARAHVLVIKKQRRYERSAVASQLSLW